MWTLVETYDTNYELTRDNLAELNCDACNKFPTFLKQYIKMGVGSIYVCDNEICLNIAILQQE